jgi:putative oxidoreductase
MSIFESARSPWTGRMLSVLRIVVGLSFMLHGTQKLFAFPTAIPGLVFDPMTQLGLAGILETFGGFAIILGLFTRPIAFVLAGEMAVAYFTAHFPRSIYPVVNQGEPAVLYCFIYLYLMFAGAGPWSIDAMISRSKPAEATSDADRRRLDAAA